MKWTVNVLQRFLDPLLFHMNGLICSYCSSRQTEVCPVIRLQLHFHTEQLVYILLVTVRRNSTCWNFVLFLAWFLSKLWFMRIPVKLFHFYHDGVIKKQNLHRFDEFVPTHVYVTMTHFKHKLWNMQMLRDTGAFCLLRRFWRYGRFPPPPTAEKRDSTQQHRRQQRPDCVLLLTHIHTHTKQKKWDP